MPRSKVHDATLRLADFVDLSEAPHWARQLVLRQLVERFTAWLISRTRDMETFVTHDPSPSVFDLNTIVPFGSGATRPIISLKVFGFYFA